MKWIYLLIIFNSVLFAQVAQVVKLKGKVYSIDKKNNKIKLFVGADINKEQTIAVSSKSRLQIVFKDKTIVSLGQNTVFSVNDYLYDSSKNSKADVSLITGTMKFLTGTIGKLSPDKFKVHARTATIGIRGTYVAAMMRNNQLGVLYLGEGKGTYVDNEYGRTELTEIGHGVFVGLNEKPKKARFWTKEQSESLLDELEFSSQDMLPIVEDTSFENLSLHGRANLYSFSRNSKNNQSSNIDTIGAYLELNSLLSVNEYFDINLGAYIQAPLNLVDKSKQSIFNEKQYSLHNVSIHKSISKTNFNVGRLKIVTPLTDSSVLRGKPSLFFRNHWYSEKNDADWWWLTPTAFEGFLAESYEIEDVKILLSFTKDFKGPIKDSFSNSLPTVNNFGNVYMFGSEYKMQKMKFQFYDLYASDFFNSIYAQVDFLEEGENSGYYTSLQYMNQKSVGDAIQKLDSSLLGYKLGAFYKGWQLWGAITRTGDNQLNEENGIITPFKGMNAFTNGYVMRNVLTSTELNPYNTDGAYAVDTIAKKLALEYDGNYDKLSQLSMMASYIHYKHQAFKTSVEEYNFDLNYNFQGEFENLNLNLKTAKVDQDKFFRLNLQYSF